MRHKSFQSIKNEETLPTSFYKVSIKLTPKLDKDIKKEEIKNQHHL